MRKKQTTIVAAKKHSNGPLVLTEAQQSEFDTSRKNPDKVGYPGLQAMFNKHGCELK